MSWTDEMKKHIRHYICRDTYFPNITTEELALLTFHTGKLISGKYKTSPPFPFPREQLRNKANPYNPPEHCLEHFRELVMCRGDISLTAFFYRRHQRTAKLLAEHECVNWKRLEKWNDERAIDLSIPGLVLPEEESESVDY